MFDSQCAISFEEAARGEPDLLCPVVVDQNELHIGKIRYCALFMYLGLHAARPTEAEEARPGPGISSSSDLPKTVSPAMKWRSSHIHGDSSRTASGNMPAICG